MTTKHELLDAAKAATADRGLNYGKPEDNFERIAARWRVHIENRFSMKVPLDAVSVALMCADLKLARLEHSPAHLDSWIDLAGYAACGAEIAARAPPAPPPLDMGAVRRLFDRVTDQRDNWLLSLWDGGGRPLTRTDVAEVLRRVLGDIATDEEYAWAAHQTQPVGGV